MDIKDEVAGLREQVKALRGQMDIVLMMLSQSAPELPSPVEVESPIITDFTQINFPI